MKRTTLILILGLLAAFAGYCTLYYSGIREHRQMLESPAPELAWLKKEFRLGDAEFERIARLHDGYRPRCAELCRRIAERNSDLQQLITGTNLDANSVGQKLKEAGIRREGSIT